MTKLQAPERVPDWLLGGQVRRRVLEGLTHSKGMTAKRLAREIDAGEATVYEVIRALKAIGAVEQTARGHYRFASDTRIAQALRALVDASRQFADRPVARPPSRAIRSGLTGLQTLSQRPRSDSSSPSQS
jgi:predicted DNA-binding transcriptional regulator YafY